MMSKTELLDWLGKLPDNSLIAIDDGGLSLREINDGEAYLELGGIPEDWASAEHLREQARNDYQREGEIEIDDNARISRGEENGAYVEAWVWVQFKEAGK